MCAPHPGGPRQGPRNAPARRPESKDARSGPCGQTARGNVPRILDTIKHLLLFRLLARALQIESTSAVSSGLPFEPERDRTYGQCRAPESNCCGDWNEL